MELYQLDMFRTVAEEENMTKAASKRFVTQPSLSRTIGRLEEELGIRLFSHVGKRIYLNEYGQLVYSYANKIFDMVDELNQAIADMKEGQSGAVKIGFALACHNSKWLDDTLSEFIITHRDVQLSLNQMTPEAIADAMENHTINIAISSSKIALQTGSITWETIYKARLGIIMPLSHHLANQSSVRVSDLANERFLLNNCNSDLLSTLTALCNNSGFQPNLHIQIDRPEIIAKLIAEGYGVALIAAERSDFGPESPSEKYLMGKNMIFVPIEDVMQEQTCYLGYRTEFSSKAVKEFIELLRKNVSL